MHRVLHYLSTRYTQVIHRSTLKQRFLCALTDFLNMRTYSQVCAVVKYSNTYARGYEQSAQAEALRCTK